jgi:type I site-specific restriction endonuclease
LIISDEAHRSIAIVAVFEYLLDMGHLTATPKDYLKNIDAKNV